MKDKLEQIFDKHHEGYAVYNKDEIIKELLLLFNVVGQSEQLVCEECKEHLVEPYAERYGKKFCLGCM